MIALLCLAYFLLPAVAGLAVGFGIRRLASRRFGGFLPVAVAAAVSFVAALIVATHLADTGIWDVLLAAGIFCCGALVETHRAMARRNSVAVMIALGCVGVAALELGTRLFLDRPAMVAVPPAASLSFKQALRPEAGGMGWDLKSKEIVCSVAYGDRYRGVPDGDVGSGVLLPASTTPDLHAIRRILHVGDSMVYGLGVSRSEAFVARLAQLESGVDHVNAGVPATAPDSYLAVLRSWMRTRKFDVAALYIFERNDLEGLDEPVPCCGWESLIDETATGAPLRCAMPTPLHFGHAGVEWLENNSPPPYPIRVLAPYSRVAALVARAITARGVASGGGHDESREQRLASLEAILRAALDATRQAGAALVVVDLPDRPWIENPAGSLRALPELAVMTQRLGIRTLDPTEMLRAAIKAGHHPFLEPSDHHFSAEGHALMASWLHESNWQAQKN